jgi:hypothetical protein
MLGAIGAFRTCKIPHYVSIGDSEIVAGLTRRSFFSQLKSLTREELMRFFVSQSLSPQFLDMALIDDGFSWLGSSASYHEARSMGEFRNL